MPITAKLIAAAAGLCAAFAFSSASATDISGAGATFPYPVYAKWADTYKKETGDNLNYQSIGSGGGIKQIQAKTVTFGASDMPLTAEQLDKNGMIQFPTVMGGVVPVVNLDGIKPGEIVLDSNALANIYLGKITKWNDPALTKLNPSVKLPNQAIAVVHRSDGSGTTFVFTEYLSKVNPAFKSTVGSNTSVQWPVGLGGKGNEGVAGSVANTKGAIGYVEYAYVKQNKMTYTKMINRDGKAVDPGSAAVQSAAAGADWAGTPGMAVIITNAPGALSWPMASATFILMYKQPKDAAASTAALKFFDWAYKNGDKLAEDLDYVPMPDAVVNLIHKVWSTEIKGADGKSLFSM